MHPRIADFLAAKTRREPIPMLTAYDFPTARLLEESGIPVLLVGDSLGMVVLGHPDTTSVTLADMLHHTCAVARGSAAAGGKALILADLPFGSDASPTLTVAHARQLLSAGAHAVKLEGGASHAAHIVALTQAEIPVMAHIGMQPQRVRIEGGYKIKGRTDEQAESLLADAETVQEAGAFGLLLELVHPPIAARITAALRIPTIGIGSGPDCDGQVLVLHDLIGLFPWFRPRFAKPRADIAAEIRRAVAEYRAAIQPQR